MEIAILGVDPRDLIVCEDLGDAHHVDLATLITDVTAVAHVSSAASSSVVLQAVSMSSPPSTVMLAGAESSTREIASAVDSSQDRDCMWHRLVRLWGITVTRLMLANTADLGEMAQPVPSPQVTPMPN